MSPGGFCPHIVPSLYVHHIVQIHVEQLMCLGGFCPWEDFIPQSPLLMLEVREYFDPKKDFELEREIILGKI